MRVQELTLDQLGSVSRGRSRHRPRDAEFLYGGPYPFVQTGDVKKAGLYLRDFEQTYSEAGLAQSKLWPVGTLCITIAANIAETSILDIEACFPDSVIGFIAQPEKADARFVKYLFDAVLKVRFQSFTQGAAQDNLSQAKLLSIKFPVPELVVQTEIANILSAYDDRIENNRRRIGLLEEAARLLYREWFVHFHFPGHEHVRIVDGIPEGWERRPLFDESDATYGHAFKSELFNETEEGLPVVRIRDVPNGTSATWTTEEAPADRRLANGDFLIGMDGDFHMNFWVGGEAWLNQRVTKIHAGSRMSIGLLRFALEEPIKNLNEAITGTTVKHLGAKHLKQMELIVPSSGLLAQANEFFENTRDMVVNLSIQNLQLAQARNLVLPRLMSGEIAV